jgi:hypothetical protein
MNAARSLLSFGPVFHKDFVSTGRRWQTHVWRIIALALPGALACWVYSQFMDMGDLLGGQALAVPFFGELLWIDPDVYHPVAAMLDPVYFAFWILRADLTQTQDLGIVLIGAQAVLALCLVWMMARLWRPLSLRRV